MRFVAHAPARRPTNEPPGERRLPSPLLRRAAQVFGQDFSHVRVTTGRAPGGPETLGAAWGDRIVLDPSLDAEPPGVREIVLAHELAHVAQQATDARARAAAGPAFTPSSLTQHAQAHLEANANAAALSLLSDRRASIVPAPLGLSRCARGAGTMITPAHFAFRTVVPIRPGDGDPAGWQAAVVRASMSKDVGGVPYGSTVCTFEVGVPLRNYLGPVPTSMAQSAAAAAANSAAYTVLSGGDPASATHCILFRRLMQAELALVIPGARVSAPITPGLPVTSFP